MAIYSVNYDLINPGQNYNDLILAIKSYNGWCHALESCWLIKTDQDATKIRDYLLKYIDKNDKILVIKVTTPAAWQALDKAVADWIHNNLK